MVTDKIPFLMKGRLTIADFFKFHRFGQNLMLVNSVGIVAWPSRHMQHTLIVVIPFVVAVGILLDSVDFQHFRFLFLLLVCIFISTHFFLKGFSRRARKEFPVTIDENYEVIKRAYNYYILIYFGFWAVIISVEFFLLNVYDK